MRKTLGLVIIMLIISLTGCASLETVESMTADINKLFPEASVDLNESVDSGTEYKNRTYSIDYKGLNFEIVNRQADLISPIFGDYKGTVIETDYVEKLLDKYGENIRNAASNYSLEFENYTGSDIIYLECNVDNVDDIENIAMAVSDIGFYIKDCFPKSTVSWFDCEICLMIRDENDALTSIDLKESYELEYDYCKELVINILADAVANRETYISGLDEEYINNRQMLQIDNLYINGELYKSDDYKPHFYYNTKDGKYYTQVKFGHISTDDDSVKMQHELIRKCYTKYTYFGLLGTSKYEFGGHKYLIKVSGDNLIVQCDNQKYKFSITDYIRAGKTITAYDNCYFVDAETYAILLGMQLDKIDNSGVYLTFNN